MAAGMFETLRDRYNGTGQTVPDRNYLRQSVARTVRMLKNVANCQSLYFVMVASIYSVAHGAMTDAFALLRPSRHFRHEVKRDANEAMKLYYNWERRLRTSLKQTEPWQLWLDLSDSVAEQVGPLIAALRDSIRAVMCSYGEPEPDLMSSLLCSERLAAIADKALGMFVDSVQRQTGFDISPMFSTISEFAPVAAKWHAACSWLMERRAGTTEDTLNFAKFGECVKASARLEEALYDISVYDRAGAYSVKLAGIDVPLDSSATNAVALGVYEDMKAMTATADGKTEIAATTDSDKKDINESINENDKSTERERIMNKTFYDVKVSYSGGDIADPVKEMRGELLVEAESLTEAELEVYRDMKVADLPVHDVLSARQTKVMKVLGKDDAEKWFKARIDELTYTASGKEKRTATYYIIGAPDIDTATAVMKRYTKDWRIQDYRLASVAETKYIKVSEREIPVQKPE